MDPATLRTWISDLRAVGIAPIHTIAREHMRRVWQLRLGKSLCFRNRFCYLSKLSAERVRLRNTGEDQLDQLSDAEQARRIALLESDRA